jgi:hypothetical protein
MLCALIPFPSGAPGPAIALGAEVTRITGGSLALRYKLAARIRDLRIPSPALTRRRDELWRHTCFEAFIRAGDGDAYCEFNLAPSTEWAAYRLSGYREGLTPIAKIESPSIDIKLKETHLVLSAELDLSTLPDLPPEAPWRLGLSAVIEAKDGSISYWALAHPPGKPDFHHPDCFALELPAPERP